MTYRVYFNRQMRTAQDLPWVIHCEETGEFWYAAHVSSNADSETEEPSKVPLKSSFIMRYDNASLTMDGTQARLERVCGTV